MLLTIATTHAPATDLGYLLHKHPERCQTFDLSFGKCHVFYPEATTERCTVAMLLDVDPIGLVRERKGPPGEGFLLQQYVNDRPYVASSFTSVAISRVLGSALAGRSELRPELAEQSIPLVATISVLPCRGGEQLLRRLFEPLGYDVSVSHHALDEQFPEWGEGPYYTVRLAASLRLRDLLTHLYVLIPVLDDDKHYWVGPDEVEKLLAKGTGWLETHPAKELIVRRYLKHRTNLARAALERLVEEESPGAEEAVEVHAAEEEAVETPLRLNDLRMRAVVAAVGESGAKSVVDLGCGEGRLLKWLLSEKSLDRIVGMDVSSRALQIAARRLNLETLPPRQRSRIDLIQGSLMYRDSRLAGYDAATVVEVIEHLDPPRVAAFERAVFEFARPRTVIVTTPNIEYNVRFETLPAGRLRHRDHRFEWTRAEFQAWAMRVAERFGYEVSFLPVGPEDAELGSPTQMGVFNQKPSLREPSAT